MPAQHASSSAPSLTLADRVRRWSLILKRAREKNGILRMAFKGGRLLFLRLARKARRVLLHRRYNRRVEELLRSIERHEGFFDLIHIPVGWNTAMFQRYQHLSLQFARLGGFVLYGGHPEVDLDLFVYQAFVPNLYIFDATDRKLYGRILSALQRKTGPRIVRVQSIDMQTSLAEISRFLELGFVVVYEYIDRISPAITGIVPEFVSARHAGLLDDDRVLILATSDALLEEVRKVRTKNYLLNTNGVDVGHWRGVRSEPPRDLIPILDGGRIVVGYHGTLAEWIDYDVLRAVIQTGRYELVLLGLEHDSSFQASGLARHPRVHFLGSRSYFELNAYAQYYDIAILPFKKNPLTDAVSPVKVFEYMAAGKPVVTTDIQECSKYAGCLVARSVDEFLEKLDLAARLKTDPDYLALLDAEVQANSWHQKVMDILLFAGVISER